ncbi:hypothetical protein [Desulfosporosinus sp. I2]|nr:hypothetical protein [Desulfosporosinus sp. I2]
MQKARRFRRFSLSADRSSNGTCTIGVITTRPVLASALTGVATERVRPA